jgi:hypothetical protein
MNPQRPLLVATLICPAVRSVASSEASPLRYDYSYQVYDKGPDRIRVESHYICRRIDWNDRTASRFQWLSDAISRASLWGRWSGRRRLLM